MKIGFLIQHFPPHLGGAECQARDLAEALVRAGHGVEVATTRCDRTQLAREMRGGVAIRRCISPAPRWLKLPWNLVAGFLLGWRLAGNCELLHGHCLSPFVLGGLLAAHCRGRPVVLKICSVGPMGDVARLRHPGLFGVPWRIASSADGFLVPTRAVGDELQAAGISPAIIHRVPSLFPQAVSPPTEIRAEDRQGVREVLFVGRLHPQKGLHTLMRAWSALGGAAGWRWVIVGDGPMRQEIGDWIVREGLQSSVVLAGYQPDPAPWFQRADVFVFPSYSESFGNVLVEALAHGCHVLTTEVGVVQDWPDHAPVVRLPVEQPAAWERALRDWAEMSSGERERRCRLARSFAAEQHHPDAVLSCLQNLYASMLSFGDGRHGAGGSC